MIYDTSEWGNGPRLLRDLRFKSEELKISLLPAGMSSRQDVHIVFRDGQKTSFHPCTVDEDALYSSINTWNNIIDLRESDATTTS